MSNECMDEHKIVLVERCSGEAMRKTALAMD